MRLFQYIGKYFLKPASFGSVFFATEAQRLSFYLKDVDFIYLLIVNYSKEEL